MRYLVEWIDNNSYVDPVHDWIDHKDIVEASSPSAAVKKILNTKSEVRKITNVFKVQKCAKKDWEPKPKKIKGPNLLAAFGKNI